MTNHNYDTLRYNKSYDNTAEKGSLSLEMWYGFRREGKNECITRYANKGNVDYENRFTKI